MRFFNTEGPVNCQDHYCLPPLSRLDMEDVRALIGQKKYFLLHAPRQTGKTTCLLALADYLNQGGQYHAVYANIEGAQAWRENVEQGMATVVTNIALGARDLVGDQGAMPLAQRVLSTAAPGSELEVFLSDWCQQLDKPLVLMLDEVDALVGDTLISLLRQLRAGYPKRPDQFPQSLILCGVRDLRDYRIQSSSGKEAITGGSAFNIKADSLHLGDFDQRETAALLLEHTAETGQESQQNPAWYVQRDGRLDLTKLLAAFQQFFSEHSEAWLDGFNYPEAGPQLLMQAFLQRIVNGGGRVDREYGLGRRRTDLLVVWNTPAGVQRAVIELKLLRGSLEATLREGLAQTWEYADRCGAAEAHLVIFDRRPGRSWEERIWQRAERHNDLTIAVWGM